MRKKKLLIFHPALAPYRIDQFNSLHELFDLEVVFLFNKLWNFNMDQGKLRDQCNFNISFLLHGPRYKSRLFRFGMYHKIRQVKPDIIMGYEYSFTTQYLILLKSLGLIRQKIGSFIDDSLDICHNVQSKARKFTRNKSIKHLDFLVVMSGEVSRFYQFNFKLKEKQMIVSPILQTSERLRKEQERVEGIAENYVEKFGLKGKKVLLFVGRFIPEKALPLFLQTISPILIERDDIILVLVGEGEEIYPIKKILKEKQLDNKVILPGKYESQELYAWYVCASGFVLPSLSETFGAVVNEALIFGLRVLCSQLAGASCLINSDNGLVFNPLDKEDALKKIDSFLEKLKVVEDISMANNPPLIENHQKEFIKEWGKLAND